LFVAFLVYVAGQEIRRSVPVFRDDEVFQAAAVGGVPAPPTARTDGAGGAEARADAELEQRVVDDLPFARPR
jgi:cation:H+ antiporter